MTSMNTHNRTLRNIWIVFKSEFLRRIRTKAFILATLLVPFGFIALGGIGAAVAIFSSDSGVDTIAVLDETGVLAQRIELPNDARTVAVSITPDSLRRAVQAEAFDAALILPAALLDGTGEAEYIGRSGGGALFRETVRDRIRRAVEDERLTRIGAPENVRAVLDERVNLKYVKMGSEGVEDEGSAIGGTALGFAMGFLIYLAVILYGSLVMQSVLEEKTNRVVEVMVSSVRPFQLLMGKVLGMGAVGLLQMLAWLVIFIGAIAFIGPVAAAFGNPRPPSSAEAEMANEAMAQFGSFLPSNLGTLVAAFLLFFLGGYLLYSSLFAAAGSAIEQMQDAQSFTLPIMIPVILAFVCITPVMENPDGTLAVILSLIPFFSPILMLVRMSVTDVPLWQLAASYLLLIAAFVGAIWLSARIYRIGILMYGKKPSLRDLAKWVRYS